MGFGRKPAQRFSTRRDSGPSLFLLNSPGFRTYVGEQKGAAFHERSDAHVTALAGYAGSTHVGPGIHRKLVCRIHSCVGASAWVGRAGVLPRLNIYVLKHMYVCHTCIIYNTLTHTRAQAGWCATTEDRLGPFTKGWASAR